ncbi:unknown [Lactobacillus phage Lb338-1]|jgi:hypothetical protein|uniref:Uncharacterized protein n=1 Tax=Lactobacillus phage Lb338-1 TaxID=2892342 RepID=C1KFG3_9CAUD|nr:hypothetical protein lb338_phage_53 [Lactobacillus phage Lb338-1]ACO36974.1 unknown [Lactobacillus phage Lb338-1]QNO01190.1 hypothetical protein [Lactobacillus phage Lbab1]
MLTKQEADKQMPVVTEEMFKQLFTNDEIYAMAKQMGMVKKSSLGGR